jgi:signal transduction histidine kinase
MELTDDELLGLIRNRFKEKPNHSHALQEMFREMEVLSNKLKQSEQLKSNFLSNIRNEINNPLSGSLGLSRHLMEVGSITPEELHRQATLIHSEIAKLDFQLQNIFTAAEIEAGFVKPEAVRFEVRQLVREVVEALSSKAAGKKISVELFFPQEDLFFDSDTSILRVIFMNLIANAIEYSKEGTSVEVDVSLEGTNLCVRVKDYGLGIELDDQSRIFARFSQLDNGTRKRHSGHGLGLSVTKELIDSLSGTLQVRSAKGLGSVFSVQVPSMQGGSATSPAPAAWMEYLFGNDAVL